MVYVNFALLAARNVTSENAAAISNVTAPAQCELSPHALVFSTVLTAFIGSIITGITTGWFTAFYSAVLSWVASLRIMVVGIWAGVEAVQGHPLKGGEQFYDFYERVPGLGRVVRGFLGSGRYSHNSDFEGTKETEPTFLACLGWLWSTVYAPVVQTLWLVQNWNHASGTLKLLRAFGVSIAALPLTMDTRARFGARMGDKLGAWSEVVFNIFTATSCLMLGVIAFIELILAAIQMPAGPYLPFLYVFFMLIATYISSIVTPYDEARLVRSFGGVIGGLAMGAFAGVFTAWPAFLVMQNAQHAPGTSLDVYLKCETVAWWQKLVSILP